MIQELLGGSSASLTGGERKISIPNPIEPSSLSSTPPATSPPSEKPNQNPNQNLRCPRCDSSNTKFCYYNNYNLTQPRHFCKTCRRYWTKGGALRNVPIGGGCRRSKTVIVTSSVLGSKTNTVMRSKTALSCEIGKLGFEEYNSNSNSNGNNHDQLLPPNPILWAPSQSSHFLSLLRSTQNPNPNPSCVGMKDEGFMSTTQALGLGQFNPFWRSNQGQGEQSGFVIGNETPGNTGVIQDLYQRLRSTGNYYQDDHLRSSVLMNSGGATTSAPCTVLESAPIGQGDLGYWNPTVNWSDLPTTNGAYH